MDNKKLTDREKAALQLAIHTGQKFSKSFLYKLAYGGTIEEVDALTSLASVANRWFDSIKVQEYYQTELAAHNARKEAERRAIEEDAVARYVAKTKTKDVKDEPITDFSNPKNIIKKLNQLIASTSDPGEQLDAIKAMLAVTVKTGEVDNRQERAIRAYLPLNCTECPLYLREKNKTK